jgi:type IV pilus assembly protein PilC
MALYNYKAMNLNGRTVMGRLEAINVIDLEMRLKRMDLDFINGETIKQRSLMNRARITRPELINFCFHLEQLARAGVSLIESLTDLRDSIENPRFREIVAGMIESIEGGKTLSQAMAEHPQTFDEVIVSLIRSGEETGALPQVLANLLESLKWQDELAAHTKKLVMYPAFLGTVVVAITLFMMIYLVPKMAGFIRSMGQDMPTQTKLLIATSEFLRQLLVRGDRPAAWSVAADESPFWSRPPFPAGALWLRPRSSCARPTLARSSARSSFPVSPPCLP